MYKRLFLQKLLKAILDSYETRGEKNHRAKNV